MAVEMIEKEIWKDVKGYEGLYIVSNKGNVKGLKYNKNICIQTNWAGYKRVQLYKNNKGKKYSVHRLVAIAFIPNPHGKEQVNHIDENKGNNRVENLEWVTNIENHNRGTINARISKSLTNNPKKSKPIYALNDNDEIIFSFPSVYEASRQTGINPCSIRDCLHHRNIHAGGYKWQFQ